MKKFKRFLTTALAVVMTASTASLVACGEPKDTEQTLQIHVNDSGYGVNWCDAMIEEFKAQPWVQEKYPNLVILEPDYNSISNFASDRLKTNAETNPFDLMFSAKLYDFFKKDGYVLDLTEVVYAQKVPGEDITFKDKMMTSYQQSSATTDTAGNVRYYNVPWAGGMEGILYNKDILDAYGIAVPNTTVEWEAACAKIAADPSKSGNEKGYSIIQSKDANYWEYLFPIWWAQYDGIEKYENFWRGKYDNFGEWEQSHEIFTDPGRYVSLNVYQMLLQGTSYVDPTSLRYEFMEQQTSFLQGKAASHVNGDWFDDEMWEVQEAVKAQNGGKIADFRIMKTPITSDIIYDYTYTTTPGNYTVGTDNVLEIITVSGSNGVSGSKGAMIKKSTSIDDDAELSALITAIDAGETAIKVDGKYDVTQEDFDRVKEARTVVYSIGPSLQAVIPSYAVGKDVAVDFLLFMATDKGLSTYLKATHGADLPFNYDVKTKDVETYNSLSQFQKDRLDYFYTDAYDTYTLPDQQSFPLNFHGGLSPLGGYTTSNWEAFSTEGSSQEPLLMFEYAIDAWNESAFNVALEKSGLLFN